MNTKIIRHGEVILKQEELPKGAELLEETKEYLVAHSETGHHHLLTSTVDYSKIKVYSFNGEKYIEVPEIAELWHKKTGKDIHKTHKVSPAVYKIIIKKEFDYFQAIIRQVKD